MFSYWYPPLSYSSHHPLPFIFFMKSYITSPPACPSCPEHVNCSTSNHILGLSIVLWTPSRPPPLRIDNNYDYITQSIDIIHRFCIKHSNIKKNILADKWVPVNMGIIDKFKTLKMETWRLTDLAMVSL